MICLAFHVWAATNSSEYDQFGRIKKTYSKETIENWNTDDFYKTYS